MTTKKIWVGKMLDNEGIDGIALWPYTNQSSCYSKTYEDIACGKGIDSKDFYAGMVAYGRNICHQEMAPNVGYLKSG